MNKYVVQLQDQRYYRDGDRTSRHFMHNATKVSLSQATTIAARIGGTVLPARHSMPIGQ